MPIFHLRQLIEEETFEADKRRLYADATRLDAILEGINLKLSRSAESGTPIPESDLWVILTAPFPDAPALGVTYSFDEEHVYMLGLELN